MTSRKILLGLAATSLLGLAQTPVMAQGSHVYLGGNLGYYRFDYEDFPSNSDEFKDDRTSWKIVAGLQPNDVFGVEGGFVDFGEVEDGSARFDSDGWMLAGTFALPLSENFAPYGKLGQLFWDSQARDIGPFGSAQDDGSDTFYGVGLRLGASESVDLRLEYERFKVDRADVDMASIGLNFLF